MCSNRSQRRYWIIIFAKDQKSSSINCNVSALWGRQPVGKLLLKCAIHSLSSFIIGLCNGVSPHQHYTIFSNWRIVHRNSSITLPWNLNISFMEKLSKISPAKYRQVVQAQCVKLAIIKMKSFYPRRSSIIFWFIYPEGLISSSGRRSTIFHWKRMGGYSAL